MQYLTFCYTYLHMKKILIALALLLLVMLAFYAFNSYIYNEKQAPAAADFKEAQYTIDGQAAVIGENGVAYFGNELWTDLDADGSEDDVVFLITSSPGGSGTFYYAVGAVNTDRGYVGTSAYFLGDRIAPQSTSMSPNPRHVGVVAVSYAERAPGEPMTTPPSVGTSVFLKLDPASMQFGIVMPDFEGESAL